eukprot:jgi/Pico_ML_1/53085/g3697.t2
MKLTLKTVAGKQFQVDADATETILKDDTTLADNGVSENGFLVVMANKAKTAAAQPASEAPPSTGTLPLQLRTW